MKDPYVYEDTGVLKNKLGIKNYDDIICKIAYSW